MEPKDKGKHKLKTKIYHILTLLTTSLSILGCILFSNVRSALMLERNTSLTINENETKSLKVELNDIYPGSENKYVINVYTKYETGLNISLKFDGSENKGDLANYLTVICESENVTVNKSLSEVLSNDESFDMGKDVKHINLTYLMSTSIGNEAQNSFADFYIEVNAKRK